MALSYVQAAQSGARFNLWVTIGECSKVICWGTWAELSELVQPIISDGPPIRAVHVLPDGEEPSFTPDHLFNDADDNADFYHVQP